MRFGLCLGLTGAVLFGCLSETQGQQYPAYGYGIDTYRTGDFRFNGQRWEYQEDEPRGVYGNPGVQTPPPATQQSQPQYQQPQPQYQQVQPQYQQVQPTPSVRSQTYPYNNYPQSGRQGIVGNSGYPSTNIYSQPRTYPVPVSSYNGYSASPILVSPQVSTPRQSAHFDDHVTVYVRTCPHVAWRRYQCYSHSCDALDAASLLEARGWQVRVVRQP